MGVGSSTSAAPPRKDSDDELVLNDVHIETGDQNAVKNLLDDTITEIVQEKKEYKIHYGWDNAKLLLMVSACVIAAVSHFYESPVITERVLIYSCVGAFFVVHALLFAYSLFVEKDVLLRMSRTGSTSSHILIKTSFPFTEPHYNITVQHVKDEKPVKVELYVGRYFDKEGYFHKDNFTKDVEAVLSRFEKKCKQQ